jgi:hypothetical protein
MSCAGAIGRRVGSGVFSMWRPEKRVEESIGSVPRSGESVREKSAASSDVGILSEDLVAAGDRGVEARIAVRTPRIATGGEGRWGANQSVLPPFCICVLHLSLFA